MKSVKKIIYLSFIICVIASCTKTENQNSEGTPLINVPGGQVGFASDTPIAIEPTPTNNNPGGGGPAETISKINVPISGTITDKNKFVIEMNIEHSQQGKISISLVAPNGVEYLFVRKAGTTGKYIGTNKLRFSSAFTNSLPNTGVDFPAGDYKESDGTVANPVPLSSIFSTIQGTSIQGLWQLKIVDTSIVSSGSLISWRLIFN